MSNPSKHWGYIRETYKGVEKEQTESDVGYTSLYEYLNVIFPEVDDWIHNKTIKDSDGKSLTRGKPDYHSPSLKLVVEFDGVLHYQKPDNIIRDINNTRLYESLGYKVIRIPYFIQLSNSAIKDLFGIEVKDQMFDEQNPSFGVKWKNTPAFMCYAGLCRMANEFHRFPKQYQVNLEALRKEKCQELAGTEYLEYFYNKIKTDETI
ncbi:MAG: endonuclease domain-containing protein [Muribaculum sp.]|nr:endonuclease domain-containing protein [Muribaculum sp.]